MFAFFTVAFTAMLAVQHLAPTLTHIGHIIVSTGCSCI